MSGFTEQSPGAARERLQRQVLGALGAGSLAALVVAAKSARDADLAPFVGPAHLGRSFLVATPEGLHLAFLTPMEREEAAATGCKLLTPEALGLEGLRRQRLTEGRLWAALLEQGLDLAGARPGRVALAGHAPAGSLHQACGYLERRGWSFSDGAPLVRRLRKRKGGWERAEALRAAAGVVAAFRRLAELLAAAVERDGELWLEEERLRVGRLRREVAKVLATHGLEQPEGNILALGRDSAVPHSQGDSGRQVRAKESLVVDLFPRGTVFADCTRTFCVGEPPEPLRRAHQSVAAALAAAERAVGPGASAWELHRATAARLEDSGYLTSLGSPGSLSGFVHGLGHGVGYELHELPSFAQEAPPEEGGLEEGDLITLEPGLYDPEAGWGVRLENLGLVGGDGFELLTDLPLDLDPRAWS